MNEATFREEWFDQFKVIETTILCVAAFCIPAFLVTSAMPTHPPYVSICNMTHARLHDITVNGISVEDVDPGKVSAAKPWRMVQSLITIHAKVGSTKLIHNMDSNPVEGHGYFPPLPSGRYIYAVEVHTIMQGELGLHARLLPSGESCSNHLQGLPATSTLSYSVSHQDLTPTDCDHAHRRTKG